MASKPQGMIDWLKSRWAPGVLLGAAGMLILAAAAIVVDARVRHLMGEQATESVADVLKQLQEDNRLANEIVGGVVSGIKLELATTDARIGGVHESLEKTRDAWNQEFGGLVTELRGVQRLLGVGDPSQPKAVFLVLQRGEREQGNGDIGTIDPAAFDMRLGFLRSVGWDGEPRFESRTEDLFEVNWSIKVAAGRDRDGTPLFDSVRIVQIADHANPAETVRAIRDAERRFECVLVVGHSNSTWAQYVCDELYFPEEVPTVLLGPTTPRITEKALEIGHTAVLRLLPPDGIQVERILELIEGRGYRHILVAEDAKNPKYSQWISERIRSRLEDVGECRVTSVEIGRHGSDLIGVRDVDAVICVALTDAAKRLVSSWENYCKAGRIQAKPDIIFTDGCTSKQLGSSIAARRDHFRDVVLLSPMPPPLDEDGTEQQSGVDLDEFGVDYTPLGMVAGGLVTYVLEETDGTISREAVRRIMSRIMYSPRAIDLRVDKPGTMEPLPVQRGLKTVWFRADDESSTVDGDNRAWPYHCYLLRVGRSRFVYFSQTGDAIEAMTPLAETAPQ